MQKKSWKNLFAYMGPGFLVSIAYIDPGNCKICSFAAKKKICSFSLLQYFQFSSFSLFHYHYEWDSEDLVWLLSVETDLQSGAQYKYGVRKWLLYLYPPTHHIVVTGHNLVSSFNFMSPTHPSVWISLLSNL